MIIGNGLIASVFKSYVWNHEKYIIFASGVSDSNETNDDEFIREEKLLLSAIFENPNRKLIYFTSVLSESKTNKYYIHKSRMECIISHTAKDYIIYRIPQLIGKIGNKSNIINVLKDNIMNDNEIIIYDGINRAILDVEDLVNIVIYSMDKINREFINISYIEKLSVLELVHLISDITNKKPSLNIIKCKGKNWFIENSYITIEWMQLYNIKTKGYTEKVLRKYI